MILSFSLASSSKVRMLTENLSVPRSAEREATVRSDLMSWFDSTSKTMIFSLGWWPTKGEISEMVLVDSMDLKLRFVLEEVEAFVMVMLPRTILGSGMGETPSENPGSLMEMVRK